MENEMNKFERELRTFHENLDALLPYLGKWVLIKGEAIHGTYDTFEAAITAGYASYGLEPFLVKKVDQAENICLITRLLEIGA